MDKYTNAVISFLQEHKSVGKVTFTPREPCSPSDLYSWESRNSPHKLPADLKSFLNVSNGFSLCWDGIVNGKSQAMGSMRLNTARQLTPVPFDQWPEDDNNNTPILTLGKGKKSERRPSNASMPAPIAAFDLDSSCTGGCVALVYISGSEAPEVWFQELSCVWSVLAQSFSDYFRLMLAHVGLPAWQSAFTPTGLVPSVRAWLRLLSPGRLSIEALSTSKKSSKQISSGGDSPRSTSSVRSLLATTSLGSDASMINSNTSSNRLKEDGLLSSAQRRPVSQRDRLFSGLPLRGDNGAMRGESERRKRTHLKA
mmetsp:Transcript_13932/g.23587  ORF Transcript_13932/g.23587 Transcript_13932/m.23587 type:complete len:311 (+) Transcript_13932:446-1378(+)